MDPSGTNPTPPPAPDSQPAWGQSAPDQPGWGQPAPDQPGWGQPGQSAPGQPAPGQPGWGQPPAWGVAPVPQKRGRSRLVGIVIAIVAFFVLAFGAYAIFGGGSDPNGGKVTFSTDMPTSNSTCQVTNEVHSVKIGTAVYATFHFKNKYKPAELAVTIDKDGGAAVPIQFSATDSVDCLGDIDNWGAEFTSPGNYHFLAKDSSGNTVSEGTLTVTQ